MLRWTLVFKLVLSLLIFMSSASPAWGSRNPAAISRAILAMVKPSQILYGHNGDQISPELVVAFNQWKAAQKTFNVVEVVPLDLAPSDNAHYVFHRIADRGLTYLFHRPEFRQSPLGQTTTEVEQAVKQEVILGSHDEVEHKLNFSLLAFQAEARVEYSAMIRAAFRYSASQAAIGFEVTESVAMNQDVVVSHLIKPENRLSEVSYRWTF